MDQQIVEKERIIDTPDKENFKIIMLSQSSQAFFLKGHTIIIQVK